MAFDTVIDKTKLESALTASANAIREKTGSTEPIAWLPDKGFAEAIGAIETGGGGSTEEEWIKDGNTHVWVSLHDSRTSPMLGVCPNGTVTVDWGDGTTPDVLTGTSTSTVKWTPTHNYASAGDYVITLTVDGEMGFYGDNGSYTGAGILRYSVDNSSINRTYQVAVRKLEIGNGVASISSYAFNGCTALASIFIPESVTSIKSYAFYRCIALASVFIPKSVTSISANAFASCRSLKSVVIPDGVTVISSSTFDGCTALTNAVIPDGVTSISTNAFNGCTTLTSVVVPQSVTAIRDLAFNNCQVLANIVIPDGVTIIGTSAFSGCLTLKGVVIPDGVTIINRSTFSSCSNLASVVIPEGVMTISASAFYNCYALTSVVIPKSVTTISSSAFSECYGVRFYDFTACTAVPSLGSTSVFTGIADDCEIRVPAALYDEWIAATNWSAYASYIRAV
jgi:hypothetical protein